LNGLTFEEKRGNVAGRVGWVLGSLPQLPRDWKLLPLLTLAMLATAANANLYVPLLVIAIAFPRLQVDPTFWLAAAMPQAATVLLRWGQLDNHQYLFMYWCLVLCLGYGAAAVRDRKRIIAFNAQALIALCMGFAVLAKLVSPSYINGAFFQYTLLLDPRFAIVSEHVGGMTEEQLNTNRQIRESLHTTRSKSEVAPRTQLESTASIPVIASWMTWWTVGIEAAIALVFAMPGGKSMRRFRNALLLVFLPTTYAIAPVVGFAWILMILGIAQCHENERKTRFAYFATFVITCMPRQIYDGVLGIFAPF
jgi:hypothetical protein